MGWQELLILTSLVSVFFGYPIGLIAGIATAGRKYPDSAVNRWYEPAQLVTATPARRLTGALLDQLIGAFTLGIGWLIWFAIVAPRGQTPGKALLSTYVLRTDGSRAGGWYVWGREFLVRGLLFGLIAVVTLGVGTLVSALWILWDPDKQTLWDKVAGSYVAFSPGGYRPRTRGELALAGEKPPAATM